MAYMIDAGVSAMASPGDAIQFVFFKTINDFLRNEIDIFQWNLLSNTTQIVGILALTLLTLWIMIQGYRIVTGQSREPMMALVGDSLRAVLVIGLATSMAATSSPLYWTLSDGLSTAISTVVTGSSSSPFQSIDNNLALMQGSMAIVDSLDTGGDQAAESAKARDKWFTGFGMAGPAVIAGCMLLLNKIALALFIGFGPLFILSLLFQQTKSFFSRWLFYGMGTLFSLAVLSVMVSISMKMVSAVSSAFVAQYLVSMATGSTTDGINSMAMQQGGLGLVLTTLIISAPPMAATFFQGTLGQFAAYSPFGRGEGGGGAAHQRVATQNGQPIPISQDTSGQTALNGQANPFTTQSTQGYVAYAGGSDVTKTGPR